MSEWHWKQIERLRRHQAQLNEMQDLFSSEEEGPLTELRWALARLETQQIALFEKAQEKELDSIY